MSRTLAKSLHTVTVLERVALFLLRNGFVAHDSHANAVGRAAHLLGYEDCDDPYSLREQAIAKIDKARPAALATPRPGPTPAELQAEGEAWEAREERWNERAREV